MIRISAFADEAYMDIDEQLSFLKSLGLKWLEIRFVNGKNVTALTLGEALQLKEKLDAAGIGISAIASPIGKYGLDKPFEDHLDLLRHTADLCKVLGTRAIRIFSFYPAEGTDIDEYYPLVKERMAAMVKVAEEKDVILLHENESHIFGHSAENCALLGKDFFGKHFSEVYDPANFVWGENNTDNVATCWPLMRPYVTHIHLKDWSLGSTDIGSIIGDGDGHIEDLIDTAIAEGYDGFMTLEPHLSSGGQFGGHTTPEQFAMSLNRLKAFLEKNETLYE